MFRLDNKITLVTGGASGIGASIAESFARAGAFVVIVDRDEKNGQEIVARLADEFANKAAFLLANVSESKSCAQVAATVLKSHGRLDVLVNNAGIGHVGTLLNTTEEDLDRLYAVNVKGVFNLTKAFLPSMLARGSGNIINLASIGGVVGIRDRVAYCTTKFAVVGFTKCIALDHAKKGIRANCICPGRVETPFVAARLKEYPDPEKAYQEMASTQALGRMGRTNEIASAALYLASEESAFITGTAFLIDGGWSAGK